MNVNHLADLGLMWVKQTGMHHLFPDRFRLAPKDPMLTIFI